MHCGRSARLIQAAQFRMNENEIAIAAGDSSAAVDAAIATANRVVVTEILNQAVELMKKSDLEITAAQLLDRSVMAGFDVPITSLGGLDASRALLASPAAPLVENLPRSVAATKVITASAEVTARLIPGVLAPLRDNGTSLAPHTRTYLLTDRILSCFAIPDLGLRWAIPLPAEMLRVTPIRDGVLVIDQPTRDTRGAQKSMMQEKFAGVLTTSQLQFPKLVSQEIDQNALSSQAMRMLLPFVSMALLVRSLLVMDTQDGAVRRQWMKLVALMQARRWLLLQARESIAMQEHLGLSQWIKPREKLLQNCPCPTTNRCSGLRSWVQAKSRLAHLKASVAGKSLEQRRDSDGFLQVGNFDPQSQVRCLVGNYL